MKYIKTFEKLESEYKVGDYILLKEDKDNPWRIYRNVKIIDERDIKRGTMSSYQVETFYLKSEEIVNFWISDEDIERKLTPKEIEDLEMKIEDLEMKRQANKYNL